MQLPSTFITFLYSAPTILILIFNRGQSFQYKIKCEFYTEIDLTNYVEYKENNQPIIYDLIGVVTHYGDSDHYGNFIAVCKSPIDNKWYQYNDDMVDAVGNFKAQILDYAMPYILFYKKRK